jgi:hypothetical protein
MSVISTRTGALVAACLAVLPYLQTLRFEFVNYDDPGHVAENPVVRDGLTPPGLAWAFGLGGPVPDAHWFNWPLTWLSHMADVSLFGLWAGGHHLTSVALHAVNAALVVAFIRSLAASARPAPSPAAIARPQPSTRRHTAAGTAWAWATVAVAAVCLPFTWVQVGVWRDSLTLFSHALATGHDSAVARNNIGLALTELGQPRDALPHLQRAVALRADDAGGWFNLGNEAEQPMP